MGYAVLFLHFNKCGRIIGELCLYNRVGNIGSSVAKAAALESGEIGGTVIDTLSVEPMEEDCILMNAKNCIITPHVAWAPIETRQRLIGIVADNIEKWLAGISQNRIV